MANILIIETVPRNNNPIDAHVRNAIAIQKGLRSKGHHVDLLFTEENSKKYQKKYDLIFASYGTQYPLIHELDQIEEKNTDTIWSWITNEYNLKPNSMFVNIFKRRKSFLLCNYEIGAVRFNYFQNQYSVNLNTLLFLDAPKCKKSLDFIYYGTYRPNREIYFKKYLTDKVYLSTSTKNHKKFLHIGVKSKPLKKFSWQTPALLNFRYSLYIEDVFSHNNFNNLANRYYESLGCRCVLLFDKSCINTLIKAKLLNYEQFIISSSDDYNKFNADNYESLLSIQSTWRDNVYIEQQNTLNQIDNIITKEISSAYST
jgi:hypothetical protein